MKTKHILVAVAGALMTLTSCVGDLDTLPLNEWDVTSETAYGAERDAYVQGLARLYFNFVTNDTTEVYRASRRICSVNLTVVLRVGECSSLDAAADTANE